MKADNVIVFFVLLLGILYGFLGHNKGASCFNNWENVSVTLTVIYAIVIYGKLLCSKKSYLKKLPRDLVITFLVVIIFITIPFSVALGGDLFGSTLLSKWAESLDAGRIVKMWLLTGTAFLFLIIDSLMMKSEKIEEIIKFNINLKYSEIPVFGVFIVLLAYSYFLGDTKITDYGLDSFFAGAVAFQMISSNIIWMQNDDKLWESIKQTQNKEEK